MRRWALENTIDDAIERDARLCPMLVRQVSLDEVSRLPFFSLRDVFLHVGNKRLAESVASADRTASPSPFKRTRTASSTSLESMASDAPAAAAAAGLQMLSQNV